MSPKPEKAMTGRESEPYIYHEGYEGYGTISKPDFMCANGSTSCSVPTEQYQMIEGSPEGISNSVDAVLDSYYVPEYQGESSVHLQPENSALVQCSDLDPSHTCAYGQQVQGYVGENSSYSYMATPAMVNYPYTNYNTGTFYSSENHY